MSKTILIIIGILCAVVMTVGIMWYRHPVNQTVNLFPIMENKKWGYIDNTGKVVIAPQFWMAYDFADGMAQVGSRDENGEFKIGYIDQSGRMAIPPRFEYFDNENFSEGLAAVRMKVPVGDSRYEEKWGYINKKGEMVIKPQFYEAGPFTNGIALVDPINDGFFSNSIYIDKTGRCVGDIYYKKIDCPDKFSEGLVTIWRDKVLCYIDKAGKTIISNPKFQCGFPFSEGLAAVRVHENFKYGYIDKTGEFVIPPQFDGASSFTNGIAKVELGNECIGIHYQFGYIDKIGKYIWGPSK